ncbi:MAG TPA: hypothetical protein VFO05_05875 [Candidatus Limnocylindrales bacterium]|nr:hypothetical protein [Candidatus Limnocylindrales bacterium]
MTRLHRHARGLLVAIAVLVLTAGAALARAADPATGSMPDAASNGLERATEVSGKTVPVAAPAAGADQDEEVDENVDEEPAAEHPDNHGAAVSEAAQGATPEEFANHGQYVRSIATDNHGQATSAERRQDQEKAAKPNR